MKKLFVFGILMCFFMCMVAEAVDIHRAIAQGDLSQVKTALAAEPDLLEFRAQDTFTPLMRAVQVGKADVASYLIEKGADLNAAADQDMTALHLAGAFGKIDCARLLLENEANVNVLDVNKRTPLFFFAGTGDVDFCRQLIKKGAEVDVYNSAGRSPLLYALWRNQTKMADFLIAKGAQIDKKDNDGLTLLHHMCVEGNDGIAAYLLNKGANISLKDKEGHSPLHLAAYYGAENTALKLIEKGVDPGQKDKAGDTPLHGAAWSGLTKTVAFLLEHGADLNAENSSGQTPLDYAVKTGHEKVITLFKDGGAIPKQITASCPPPHKGKVGPGQIKPMTMTVLYDNTIAVEGTRAEWGFSCLIEGTDETILLDTGGDGEVFKHNVDFLKVDLKKVDKVVISHNHWDHTGGLMEFLKVNPDAPIYIPYGFPYDFVRKVEQAGGKVVPVKEACEISKNVYLTGQMGQAIIEIAVIVNSPKGLIIVTGCSHPGIAGMVRKSKEVLQKDIYLVFGGFHLMAHTEAQVEAIIGEFKEMGVEKCGATHCTGDKAIAQFRQAFGKDYVPIGSGRVLHFTKDGITKKK
jgi:7,8-dihydropterin-6-yl-methyl-4-(beta-D-ribofuranosyl)aminobenzene 5'-phosphate synthase